MGRKKTTYYCIFSWKRSPALRCLMYDYGLNVKRRKAARAPHESSFVKRKSLKNECESSWRINVGAYPAARRSFSHTIVVNGPSEPSRTEPGGDRALLPSSPPPPNLSLIYCLLSPVCLLLLSSSLTDQVLISFNEWAGTVKSFILSQPQLFSSKESKSSD